MKPWLQRLVDTWSRISTQLYLGIGAAVVLTVAASLVGWVFFSRVGEVQSRVTNESVPALATAFAIAQGGNALATAAPRLVSAPSDTEFDRVASTVLQDRKSFSDRLDALSVDDPQARRVTAWGRALDDNIAAVQYAVRARFAQEAERDQLRDEIAVAYRNLTGLLVPAIDDQLFYAVTGYHTLGEPPAPPEEHLSEEVFTRYRILEELHSMAAVYNQIVSNVFNVRDETRLEPLRERLDAVERDVRRRLDNLGEGQLKDNLVKSYQGLRELGTGERGSLLLRAQEFGVLKRQRALLLQNRALANELLFETGRLVDTAKSSARDATRASSEAITIGQRILLVLSLLSVVGAVLIGWLFIGRVLVRRIALLSSRMRRMAEGDLEEAVEVSGRDEISEMSSALEVFRRHALEVQRLNLVEKLAEELQSKNQQLEDTMVNLETAQDQIVMREKLAALGELTAGVAHEIRNPLNFIKNYAESSQELMDEMMEEFQAVVGEPDNDNEEQKEGLEMIQDIREDLKGNLDIIRHHGQRADSIVQSMLLMGRGSGDRFPTNINTLLDEHARLAYHSARATDNEFQMEISQDLDPDMVEIEVVPQDLGRVFLNMVSNACYATNEKRRRNQEARKAGEETEVYQPLLRISTRKLDDEVEVRVRDNGVGIPADVLDKIFNPFFTTKPTDKGTGLGLALSNDIVREHGGRIEVDTEPGSFTEMVIHIPLLTAASRLEQEADGADVAAGGG